MHTCWHAAVYPAGSATMATLWVAVRWSCDKAGCESQKFKQVSAMHELPAQPLIRSWNPSVCYVAQSLSVELVPVLQLSGSHRVCCECIQLESSSLPVVPFTTTVYSAKHGHVLLWMWSFMVMQSCMCGAHSGSPQPVYMSYMAVYNHWTGLVDLTSAPEWWTDATKNSYDPQPNLLTHRGA